MCGILCIWRRDQRPVDLQALRAGTETMRHRGPNDEGYTLINSRSLAWVACGGGKTDPRLRLPDLSQYDELTCDFALGQTRLSILDLSPAGHQPMATPEGHLHVTYNGEIYNYREIRADLQARGYVFHTGTDTEVILHAYQEWGPDCLKRFNGMWAFALWDAPKHRLFVARDRFGVKPLVYYEGPDHFVCASEITAIVADPEVPREIDPQALHHYFSLMVIPAPFTIYKAIRKLLPGHYMLVDSDGVHVHRYWDLQSAESAEETEEEAIEHLDALLQDSVQLRLTADVPVGAFLSGGVDSSVVSALAARQNGDAKFHTFSISFSGLERYDESAWASRVAAHIGSEHKRYELSLEFSDVLSQFSALVDEPFASASVLGVYLLARHASQEFKVVLTGDGGDEVFAGYYHRHFGIDSAWDGFHRSPLGWLRAATAVNGWPSVRWQPENLVQRLSRRWQWEHLPERTVRDRCYIRSITWSASEAEKRRLYTPEWAEQSRYASTEDWLSNQLPPLNGDRLSRWQAFDLKTTLADEMLAKVDKATMAWGLEARVPLLDYRVVQYALCLQIALKAQHGQGKFLLKRLGERYLPREDLYRRKQGFTVPLAEWLRGELRQLLGDMLSPALLRRQGLFRPEVVHRIIALHQSDEQQDYSALLYNLICFQLWYERRT